MYSFCDAVISGLSLLTLAAVLYLIRRAFRKHYLNVFSHMMLILIVFGLISKYHDYLNHTYISACMLLFY